MPAHVRVPITLIDHPDAASTTGVAPNVAVSRSGRKRLQLPRAGSSLDEFCAAVGFCRATYYNLPPELRPRSVLIGRRRIIIEHPPEYLARLAAAQMGAAE
jgi:hypothetical protein